ncbi:MAG TPA: SDR family oxidoreductase [Roseimicrobium sp.]|nr:SDR family oxidoreductase [Roseimicrobium sp.]
MQGTPLFSLKGHSALVTGSSQGIGFSAAMAMREAGAEVVFHGTRPRPREIPPESPYLAAELREASAPSDLIHGVLKRLPSLDLLVCNAGAFFDVPFFEMNSNRWKHTIQLHMTSTYFLVQEFSRHLAGQGRPGAVVLITSTSAVHPEPDSTAYDIAKGGVTTMVRSFATALAKDGIRVNGVAPGLIRTHFLEERLKKRTDPVGSYRNRVLLGELGNPEDCAGSVVFLCSKAAKYITGHIITVDGGLSSSQSGLL